MEKVLVTGSAGFIGGYVVEELLRQGYEVVGIDNYSKYGPVKKSYDDNPNYELVVADVLDTALMTELLMDCDHFIAGAALIGGISYFHTYQYDLIAANERIIASSCDAAIAVEEGGRQAQEGHLHVVVDGVRVDRPLALEGGRRAHRPAAAVVLRLPEARRRVLRARAPRTSTTSTTRSCARSTASASASRARSATSRSTPATCSSP